MAQNTKSKSVDVKTGIGTLSFPKVFEETKVKNDKGEYEYSAQIIIPKSDKKTLKAIMSAIKEVGESKWGEGRWQKVRTPLRDGDAEKDNMDDNGVSYGEKYPERLGCYFINARSKKPIGIVDRDLTPIVDSGKLYAGCKVKMHLSFYAYASNGNSGIGAGLNGIQFVADGDSLGGGRPSVDSMFDELDESDDFGLDDEVEEQEQPAKKDKKSKKGKKNKG